MRDVSVSIAFLIGWVMGFIVALLIFNQATKQVSVGRYQFKEGMNEIRVYDSQEGVIYVLNPDAKGHIVKVNVVSGVASFRPILVIDKAKFLEQKKAK